MARTDRLTVAEALAQANLIDQSLAAWDATAPQFVASVGGRDRLARMSEMTCVGPVPRLDERAWERASGEYLERWAEGAVGRQVAHRVVRDRVPVVDVVLPGDAPICEPATPAKRSRWGIFSR